MKFKTSLKQFFTVIALLSITGCATYNTATKRTELAFISTNSEMSLGKEIDAQIQAKYRIVTVKQYQLKLESVGRRIVSAIDKRGIGYKFRVVEDANMNAFTIPGGYIYATTGLLTEVKSDDELAAVLAHEIAHTEARHAVKHLEAAKGYNLLMNLAQVVSLQNEKQKASWQQIKSATDTTYNLISLGYSRKDELEADKLSVDYLRRAGYNPQAIITLFQKLKAKTKSNEPKWLYFLKSHPYIDQRMEAASLEIAKNK